MKGFVIAVVGAFLYVVFRLFASDKGHGPFGR